MVQTGTKGLVAGGRSCPPLHGAWSGTYLGAEAVTQCANLLDAVLLLQELDRINNDGIDSLLGVGVLSAGAVLQPSHDVEVGGALDGNRIAVEEVNDQGLVAVLCKLVGHKLAVLPDAEDVSDVEKRDILVRLVRGGCCEVAFVFAGDSDLFASGGSSTVQVNHVNLREVCAYFQLQCFMQGFGSGLLVLNADSTALSRRVGGHCDFGEGAEAC